MSPFDINSVVFHFDVLITEGDHNHFFLTIVTRLVFFHNL